MHRNETRLHFVGICPKGSPRDWTFTAQTIHIANAGTYTNIAA